MKFIKKNMLFIFAALLLIASVIFFVYNIKADSDDDKIGISYADMTSIQTGTESFSSDGLSYNDTADYHKTSGYTAGGDANDRNAIVRSYDKIVYNFEFGIKNKDELTQTSNLTPYSNKTILVKATVSNEAAPYVVFDENGKPGQASYTYEINGVNEINGSKVTASIPIYVLGAPNGTIIDPKFEIQESTNTDSNYVVTLGKKDNSTHNYLYDPLRDQTYKTTADFYNYMPTVVSSVNNLDLSLEILDGEPQKATYENKIGRYMNYVVGLVANGTLKGHTMPTGDITLNGTVSQTGHESAVLKNDFIRLYNGAKVGDINPIVLNAPYSATTMVSRDKYTRNPGSVTVNSINGNAFEMKISNYNMPYSFPTSGSDNNALNSNKHYIGTYAITVFSPRVPDDGTSNINVTLNINSANVSLTGGSATLPAVSKTSVNEAYETTDYNLKTGFYEMSGERIGDNNVNGRGAKSRGSDILYITEFNYLSTSSNDGLKEVIKIDPVAYRFRQFSSTNDIDIKIYCGNEECTNIKASDFEYEFIAGDFNASNYTATNYDTVNSRIKSEDANVIKSGCLTVKNNLSSYNSDQIMNLYGGPCISENNAQTYGKISEAVTDDDKEIILTKLVVQTKNGKKLPDNAKVIIRTKLRVRNVPDISRTYQVATIATSSDHDSKITYYSPRVVNANSNEDVVTNPNNYRKTDYNNHIYDDSLFGETLKILGFETKQKITVTNKKKDGKMKTNFNAVDNETIHFKVSTNLEDLGTTVGADDAWFMRDLRFTVIIPNSLVYMPNEYVVNPVSVSQVPGGTRLDYVIDYSKPNQHIPEVFFDAVLSPNLVGNANEIEVRSYIEGTNIGGETVDYLNSEASLIIYGNGINNMILTLANDSNTVVDKNEEFSYYINAFNNTNTQIDDYIILNVLPYNNDEKGSSFNGTYKVHLDAENLGNAKVLCSTEDQKNINYDVLDEENIFTDCSDIFNDGEYKEVTAIKITDISAAAHSAMTPIKVTIKPTDNKFSDVYKINAVGGSATYMPTNANELSFSIVNRKITGKVYIDVEEDGVQLGNEKPLGNIPVALYKIVDDLNKELVATTATLDSGVYAFENLEKGLYLVQFNYDDASYDLTLRYAIEDTERDSDAYKIAEGLAEITNKHTPDTVNGIDLINNVEASHMDMGLINRKPFSMSIKKYITKVDLNYNGITDTKLYNNESKVIVSVRNSLKANAKVYYGFEIINDSQVRGTVENIYEDIPDGLFFDGTDPYNEGWVLVGNGLQNTSFKDIILAPGESIYAQIALTMPAREEAGAFLNKVSLDIKKADPIVDPEDSSYDASSTYSVGDSVYYAGLHWHAINTTTNGSDEFVTLLLDSSDATANGDMGYDVYKWSNVSFTTGGNLNEVKHTLEDNIICDDASGLMRGSFGGTLKSQSNNCISGQYVTSKVRLLTKAEFNEIINRNLQDVSWLYGTKDYYLQTAIATPTVYDGYGNTSENHSNEVNYVRHNNGSIGPVKITDTPRKAFRYVITVNVKNILNY